MPKKQPKNSYFFYMLEYKRKEERRGYRLSLAEVSVRASPSWKAMNAQQRGPYEKMAKEEKYNNKGMEERYSSQGVPLSEIEGIRREKDRKVQNMKDDIKNTVLSSFLNNDIDSKNYYFMMVNYFCRPLNGEYIPAEIGLAKYSLGEGVISKFHAYVNPGKLPTGYAYEGQKHSDESHRLPVPPDAMGSKSLQNIVTSIINFIGSDSDMDNLPPIYTSDVNIPIIESVFRYLCMDLGVDPENFRIYSVTELFYVLKSEAIKRAVNSDETCYTYQMMKAEIDKDVHETTKGISCQYHENNDCAKHCAISVVTRWAYTFSAHICQSLNIPLIPIHHIPATFDTTVISSKHDLIDDNEQSISESLDSKPTGSIHRLNDYDNYDTDSTMKTESNFPSLPLRGRHGPKSGSHMKVEAAIAGGSYFAPQDVSVDNVWTARTKDKPRLPKDETLADPMAVQNRSGFGRGQLLKNPFRSE